MKGPVTSRCGEFLIQGFPDSGCHAALWAGGHPWCPLLLCLAYPDRQCEFLEGVGIRLRTVQGLAVQFREPTLI